MKRSERRAAAARASEAEAALRALYAARRDAFRLLDRCADDAMLESAILEICALDRRCARARAQMQGGMTSDAADPDPARRRRRAAQSAAEDPAQAH